MVAPHQIQPLPYKMHVNDACALFPLLKGSGLNICVTTCRPKIKTTIENHRSKKRKALWMKKYMHIKSRMYVKIERQNYKCKKLSSLFCHDLFFYTALLKHLTQFSHRQNTINHIKHKYLQSCQSIGTTNLKHEVSKHTNLVFKLAINWNSFLIVATSKWKKTCSHSLSCLRT